MTEPYPPQQHNPGQPHTSPPSAHSSSPQNPSPQNSSPQNPAQPYGSGGWQQTGWQQTGVQQGGVQPETVLQQDDSWQHGFAGAGDAWQQGGQFHPGPQVAMAPGPVEPPKSNVGWAVAAVVFFWPLAFSAFTHAMDVYPAWARGDLPRAMYHSERARKLGQWALGVWAAMLAMFVVFYVVVIAAVISAGSSAGW